MFLASIDPKGIRHTSTQSQIAFEILLSAFNSNQQMLFEIVADVV